MKILFAHAIAAILLASGCGQRPPNVHQHVPKVPTKPVAIGAVAAATALTLANPDATGKPQEDPTAPRNLKFKKSDEQVPMAVLDRADDQPASDEQAPESDCPESGASDSEADEGTARKRPPKLELVPTAGPHGQVETPPRSSRCPREPDERPAPDEPSSDAGEPGTPRPSEP